MEKKCENKRMMAWCNGDDVKRVQLRSMCATSVNPDKFEGPIINMCEGCRKLRKNSFKIINNDFVICVHISKEYEVEE